jgi:hypothetical protein
MLLYSDHGSSGDVRKSVVTHIRFFVKHESMHWSPPQLTKSCARGSRTILWRRAVGRKTSLQNLKRASQSITIGLHRGFLVSCNAVHRIYRREHSKLDAEHHTHTYTICYFIDVESLQFNRGSLFFEVSISVSRLQIIKVEPPKTIAI